MRRLLLSTTLALAAMAWNPCSLQGQAPLDEQIAARFPLTKATADRTDIVTAGAVMDLKKDGVLMYAIDAHRGAQLVYKDGHIQPSTATKMLSFSVLGHTGSDIAHRTYVAGEKVWLVDVQTASDGVVLQLLSDPVADVRYTAFLKFPFAKGGEPHADQILAQIGQVLSPEAANNAPAAQVAAAPAPMAPMAPIPPPPPPPDQPAAPPPTLEKGQTKDQVIASFGAPTRVVKLGAKEIDYYKDMKVTFINNKVSNVE